MADLKRSGATAARELASKLVGMTEQEARDEAAQLNVHLDLVPRGVGIRAVRTDHVVAIVSDGRIVHAASG